MRTHTGTRSLLALTLLLSSAVYSSALTCDDTLNPTTSWEADATQALLDAPSVPFTLCLNPGLYEGCGFGVMPTTNFTGRVNVVGLPDGSGAFPTLDCNLAGRAFYVYGNGTSVLVANMTIKNGIEYSLPRGGAILAEANSVVTLEGVRFDSCTHTTLHAETNVRVYARGCTFYNNTASSGAGGAMKAILSTVELTNCNFTNNKMLGSEGGGDGGAVLLENTVFTSYNSTYSLNSARLGGAFSIYSSTATMHGDTVSNNWCDGDGGGFALYNGARATLSGVTVTDNTAIGLGGGIHVEYGTVTLTDSCAVIGNNATGSGGGIGATEYSNVTVEHSSVSNNFAELYGAGIYATSSVDLVLVAATVSSNTALNYGGGVYASSSSTISMDEGTSVSNNMATNAGGGVYANMSDISFLSGRVSNNNVTADGGNAGGIYLFNGTHVIKSEASVANNTVGTSGTAGGIELRIGSLTLSGGRVEGNTADEGGGVYVWVGGTVTVGTGGEIVNNVARGFGQGGGIQVKDGSVVVLESGGVIGGNVAGAGGGVWVQDGHIEISGTVADNSVSDSDGGGLYISNTGSCNVSSTALFTGNSARSSGGGLQALGHLNVHTGAQFINNTAGSGGAVYRTYVPSHTFSGIFVAKQRLGANLPGA